jgi:RNA polymerase sigma factor (sigma-70 family)
MTCPRTIPHPSSSPTRTGPAPLTTPPRDPIQWPGRLIALARQVREEGGSGRAGAELWTLVGVVLRQRLRSFGRPGSGWGSDDLEDVVSDKLLDLLARFDSRAWRPEQSHPGEVVNFLTAVARNAIADLSRRAARRSFVGEERIDLEERSQGRWTSPPPERAEAGEERRRFVDGLLHCCAGLSARDRNIWALRAVLELSTREIAGHPNVNLREDHVNVILKRCRDQLRRCMRGAGFELGALPPGTLLMLWERTWDPGSEPSA